MLVFLLASCKHSAQFIVVTEIVTWKKNLLKLPTGGAAKAFINELSLWLERFNRKAEQHSMALKVYIILPALMHAPETI